MAYWLFIFIFIPHFSFCEEADIQLEAYVDTSHVSQDQVFRYILKIESFSDLGHIEVMPPDFNGFDFLSKGESHGLSIINGHKSVYQEIYFNLKPKKEGNLTISAMKVRLNGRTYTSNKVSVWVEGASTSNYSKASPKKVQVHAFLNKNEVYLNEELEYTFQFKTQQDLLSQPSYTPPQFKNFWKQPLQGENNYRDGSFMVSELKYLLYPLLSGSLTINEAQLQCKVRTPSAHSNRGRDLFDIFYEDAFGGYLSGEEYLLKTKPLQVKVKPLPETDLTFSGAVGSFEMTVDYEEGEVIQGNPLLIKVSMRGYGYLKKEHLASFHLESPQSLTVYDPVSMQLEEQQTSQGLLKKLSYEITLVPQVEGKVLLPSFVFVYFSPQDEKYISLKSKKKEVFVSVNKNFQHSSSKGITQYDNYLPPTERQSPSPPDTPSFVVRGMKVSISLFSKVSQYFLKVKKYSIYIYILFILMMVISFLIKMYIVKFFKRKQSIISEIKKMKQDILVIKLEENKAEFYEKVETICFHIYKKYHQNSEKKQLITQDIFLDFLEKNDKFSSEDKKWWIKTIEKGRQMRFFKGGEFFSQKDVEIDLKQFLLFLDKMQLTKRKN